MEGLPWVGIIPFIHFFSRGSSMRTWYRILVFLLVVPFLTCCSGDQEKTGKKEKSAIQQRTDQAAKEAVDRIQVPLDQARTAAEQENAYKRQLEEQEKK
jgi:VanZ family protein